MYRILSVIIGVFIFLNVVPSDNRALAAHGTDEAGTTRSASSRPRCRDGSAAIIRCNEGDVLTHEGCPGESTIVRCASCSDFRTLLCPEGSKPGAIQQCPGQFLGDCWGGLTFRDPKDPITYKCGDRPEDFFLSEDEPNKAFLNNGLKRCSLSCKKQTSGSFSWICKPKDADSCGSLKSVKVARSGKFVHVFEEGSAKPTKKLCE